jgi:hypothetical protein
MSRPPIRKNCAKETAVSRLPKLSPEIASAALAARRPYHETRLALELPVPDFYRDPVPDGQTISEPKDDAAALILDRDGSFTWVKF